jgi:hypothetical protein
MWTIKVTYHSDFQKDQHHSVEHQLTDLTINNASPQLLAEIFKSCVLDVKRGIEDIEA